MVLEHSTEDTVAEIMYKPKITRGVADRTLRGWVNSGVKAVNLDQELRITESYLLYVPFWRFVAQGLAVACGHSGYTERTGNKLRNEFEELINDEYTWTKCACDTGQYGLTTLWLDKGGEVPYVHGSVAAIDPSGSALDANKEGKEAVRAMMRKDMAKRIETVTFEKLFIIPKLFELVYAPVWVYHYQYNKGHFTVLIDAVRGEIIGGTSPMDMTARTRLMILSFSIAAFLFGTNLAMLLKPGEEFVSTLVQIILLLVSVALAMVAYPAFREGKTTTSTGSMQNIAQMRPAVRIPKELVDEDLLMHRGTVLECPFCKSQISRPWGEVIARCEKCSTLLDINSENAEVVPYEVVKPSMLAETAMPYVVPEYIPFWKFSCNIEVTDYLASGKTDTALPDITGRRDYFICAADIPRYIAEPWEIDLTVRNPKMETISATSLLNMRYIYMNKNTARELTEFLYLRYETEKPGVLQVLRYNFDVKDAKIVYIPYFKEKDTYVPGV
ncbi:MAG TPA: hypothetical protein O0X27_03460 [Methanocorpusculum sp.]|nr:hypothetical protein [Methanocorpusculum sp.]